MIQWTVTARLGCSNGGGRRENLWSEASYELSIKMFFLFFVFYFFPFSIINPLSIILKDNAALKMEIGWLLCCLCASPIVWRDCFHFFLSRYSLLTLVSEAICHLIYPFRWQVSPFNFYLLIYDHCSIIKTWCSMDAFMVTCLGAAVFLLYVFFLKIYKAYR